MVHEMTERLGLVFPLEGSAFNSDFGVVFLVLMGVDGVVNHGPENTRDVEREEGHEEVRVKEDGIVTQHSCKRDKCPSVEGEAKNELGVVCESL